jgi:hypothetical protein
MSKYKQIEISIYKNQENKLNKCKTNLIYYTPLEKKFVCVLFIYIYIYIFLFMYRGKEEHQFGTQVG